MSQPPLAPYDISRLVAPALDGILRAVADRGDQTEAEIQARAAGFQTLILSFQPADAVDLQLAAQTVLFNEVLADSTHDALKGMDDDRLKARTISGLISMGRLMQGHLDRLEKRGNKPFRTEIAAPQPETRARPKPNPPSSEPAQPRPRAAAQPPSPPPVAPPPAAPPPAEPDEANSEGRAKAAETSWLDAPYEQWLIENPADIAVRAAASHVAAQAANLPMPPKSVPPRNGAAEIPPPPQRDQVRALMEAAGTLSRMPS